MESCTGKPTLLFIRCRYSSLLPRFLLTHIQEQTRCLAQFFRVIVVDGDCDYAQLCDMHNPDLALFESGVNHSTCVRPNIHNAHACPAVPKLGFQHGDGFCNARAGFISDMDHWGIETFFSISTTAAEHMPNLADRLFVWPVFADPELYHDYGERKLIPILFTGNRNQFYPWRTQMLEVLSTHYPTLVCPHPGYETHPQPISAITGERYAQTINASWFVPACGTVAKEVIRKHFEVPASRSCLIAERSRGLDAAGFVDMENCVFADPENVIDKVHYLLANPERLHAIIDAGYNLAHSRHEMAHRSQIYDWFSLRKRLKADECIVQRNPFLPLSIEPAGGAAAHYIRSSGIHLELLRLGDHKLFAGRYSEAQEYYLRCNAHMRWIPEVKLKLALCRLYQGDPRGALLWIDDPVHFTLCVYGAKDPDPIEWAYYCICLLCAGRAGAAARSVTEYSALCHPELDRTRWAISSIVNRAPQPSRSTHSSRQRMSIHQLPQRNIEEWSKQICVMLEACGQIQYARSLAAALSALSTGGGGQQRECLDTVGGVVTPKCERPWRATRPLLRRMRFRQLQRMVKRRIGSVLHGVERRYRYFLPFQISDARSDKLCKLVHATAGKENIKAALLIGARPGKLSTEAFFHGTETRHDKPAVFCLQDTGWRLLDRKEPRHSSFAKWYSVNGRLRRPLRPLGELLEQIRDENRNNSFDLLMVGGAGFGEHVALNDLLKEEFRAASVVILEDLNKIDNHLASTILMNDPEFMLVEYDPDLHNGFAVFKRCAAKKVRAI